MGVRLLLRHPDVDVHRPMKSNKGWTTPLDAAREAGRGTPIYCAFVEQGLLPSALGDGVLEEVPMGRVGGHVEALGRGPAPAASSRAGAKVCAARSSYGGVPLSARREAVQARIKMYGRFHNG